MSWRWPWSAARRPRLSSSVRALLLKHAAFLTQAWNKGLPVVEVTRLLKIEAAEWKDSDAASGHKEGDAAGNGRAPVTLRGVTDAALRRAILENDS